MPGGPGKSLLGLLLFESRGRGRARAEVLEETGLYIKNVRHGEFTNDIFTEEKKHYVTLFVTAEYDHGKLELKEPHKCERWDWFRWDDLPEPRFLPLENLIKQGFSI